MVGEILLLAIAILGISILSGKGKAENYYKFLIWLILAPILSAIGFNYVSRFWYGLPLWMQVLCFLLVPFIFSALLRLICPKTKWLQGLQTVIFQTLIYVVTFPLRFLWRLSRFFLQQERRAQKLNPYRPVVGGRPPIQNERRETEQRNNIFD
ncbi:MAG: hypothetical protein ACR2N3_02625 [Pyrinomonadaceae bacterium]